MVKNLPASAGDIRDVGLFPGSGRSPEGGMATHSRILAWRIPVDRRAGRAVVDKFAELHMTEGTYALTHNQ